MMVSAPESASSGTAPESGRGPVRGPVRGVAVDTDVAIVGAGAAGIAAAQACAQAGLAYELLEARPRAGGRAVTDDSLLGVPVDLGASWIHAAHRGNPWLDLARAEGFTLMTDPKRREIFAQGRHAPECVADFDRARRAAMRRIARGAGAATSVGALLPENGAFAPACRALVGPWISGVTVDALDAGDWNAGLGGDDRLVREGYGRLVARQAAGCRIRTGSVVEAIALRGDSVRLRTSRGSLSARAAVVTVSTGVLASGRIAFDPPLPETTRAAIAGLPMGLLMKLVVGLDGDPLGLGDNYFALDAAAGPEDVLFLMRPFGFVMAYGFIGGDAAWRLERAGPAAADALARDALARLAGTAAARRVTRVHATGWGGDPWSLGSYSAARPGHGPAGQDARAALARPVHGRIHLAGEASAPRGWHATVAGAWLAGIAAIRRIQATLGRQG